MFVVVQPPVAETGADIEFVLVVAGGHDLNDECIFEVMSRLAAVVAAAAVVVVVVAVVLVVAPVVVVAVRACLSWTIPIIITASEYGWCCLKPSCVMFDAECFPHSVYPCGVHFAQLCRPNNQ